MKRKTNKIFNRKEVHKEMKCIKFLKNIKWNNKPKRTYCNSQNLYEIKENNVNLTR